MITIAPQRWEGRALAAARLDTPLMVLENDLGEDAVRHGGHLGGRPDFPETGTRALRLPLPQLDGSPEAAVDRVVPVALIVRRSTGPAPRS